MRVICGQLYCPVCRTELSKVYFSRKPPSKKDVPELATFNRHGICFLDQDIADEFNRLFENRCTFCNGVFDSFEMLASHMSQEHRRAYCTICFQTLKLFPFERRFYTREEFARHSICGDADDSSFTGHPLCSFCRKRFFDKDELYRHSTVDHFYCSFCAADGKITFYKEYEELREHFRNNHFLCEHPDCRHLELRSHVFQTEIELKTHVLECHTEQNRQARRQAGHVAPDYLFNYQARQSRRSDAQRDDAPSSVQSANQMIGATEGGVPCDFNEENFPTLEAARLADSSAAAGKTNAYDSELRSWLAENLPKPPSVEVSRKQEARSPPPKQLPASCAYAQAVVSARKFDLDDEEFPRLPSAKSSFTTSKPQWIGRVESSLVAPKPEWTAKMKPKRESGAKKPATPKAEALLKAADFPALSSPRSEQKLSAKKQPESCWSLKSIVQSLHEEPKESEDPQPNGELSPVTDGTNRPTLEPRRPTEDDFPMLLTTALPAPVDRNWRKWSTDRNCQEAPAVNPEKEKPNAYLPPVNFDRRKAMLAFKIRESVGDNELLYDSFKRAHSAFCAGKMSVVDFYNKSINTVGAKALKAFIFELIALLPDIEKQQELYKTARLLLQPSSRQEKKTRQNRQMRWDVEPLQSCHHCGQMLDENDLPLHRYYHENQPTSRS